MPLQAPIQEKQIIIPQFEKVSDTIIKRINPVVIQNIEQTYDVAQLNKRRQLLVNMRDHFVADRNKEIADIDVLLAECQKLNIVETTPVVTPINPVNDSPLPMEKLK